MQVFVGDNCTVIAAPVQCDVDGVPKGSHYVRVPIAMGRPNAGSQRPGGEQREPPVRWTALLDTWPRRSKDLVDPKIDIAGLRCLSAFPQEQLDEVDPALQYRHQIAAIHENHQPAARGVSLDAILREAIDR
jgi:hypothetical protein